jgi:hypothetical protein
MRRRLRSRFEGYKSIVIYSNKPFIITVRFRVKRDGCLRNIKIVIIGISLLVSGILILALSNIEPPVLTPSEWVEQINHPEDVEPPRAERFQQFDPGDVLYVEGDVYYMAYFNGSDKTVIGITDGQEMCAFEAKGNITNLPNYDEHIYLKIEIREQGTSAGSYILSGNEPYYFKEEAVWTSYEKEHNSYDSILLILGTIAFIIGLVITIYSAFSKGTLEKGRQENNKDE